MAYQKAELVSAYSVEMSTLEDISGLAGNPAVIVTIIALFLTQHMEQFMQLLVAFMLIYAIVFPIRMIWFKPRPKKMSYDSHNPFQKFEANCLISVHTARATIMAFVLAMMFSGNLAIQALFFAFIPFVGASRVALQKHPIYDVIIGFLLGAGIAVLVLNFV